MPHPLPVVDGFRCEIVDSVATLTIDRPGKLGALSTEMWEALPEIVGVLEARDDVVALIIRGTGGNFSVGSDIGDLSSELAEFWRVNAGAEAALAETDLPTIAAIEGYCVGGGSELASACDVRIAAPGSRFGITPTKLGLLYPPEPTRRFADAIGESWARYLLLTGELIDTERADALGFLHRIAQDPYAAAVETAQVIAQRSTFSQTGALRFLRGEDVDPTGWAAEAHRMELEEGRSAFFDRREARFTFRRSDWQGD